MDLIPKPDQVVWAAANLAQRVTSGGLADLRPMPRTLIEEGSLREVYHYLPEADAPDPGEPGDPVLLVTPLAAPALCYDLRRGCSLVEHLVGRGRPTYLVEYGAVSFRDRDLGMEPWVDEVVPTAVREVSAHAGGRPVHLVGWSLGGTFALLAAAGAPELPVASVTVLGSPFDVRQVPLVAPTRPLITLTDVPPALAGILQAVGGAPGLRWAAELSSVQRLVTKPLAMARNLDDADYLAQVEAVDRFTANMTAYPGRTFGQLYHRLLKANGLVDGTFDLGDRTVSVADITAPVLVFGGANDGIAPLGSVKTVVPLLRSSREARLEIVPGGHLGMLTGRGARTSTWPVLDAWIDEWSARPVAAKTRARRSATKAPAKKGAAKKTTKKKTTTKRVAKKTATRKTSGSREIGVKPERRYGSAGSRALRRPGR